MVETHHIKLAVCTVLFSCVLMLCCCNKKKQPEGNPGQPAVTEKTELDILEATENRKLDLKVTGDQSNSMTLEFIVRSNRPIVVRLEPGYLATCTDFGALPDKLIVEKHEFKLEPKQHITKTVRALNTEYPASSAGGEKLEFKLEKLPPDEPLARVASYLINNPDIAEKTALIASWAAAEKMSFVMLRALRLEGSEEPFASGRGYLDALEVLRKAGVRIANLRFSLETERVILDYSDILKRHDRKDSLDAIENLRWFHGVQRATSVLVALLEDEEDALLRERAAEALGESGLESVKETLYQTLELDPVRTVRRAAAFALAKLGELTAVPLAIMFIGDKGLEKKEVRLVTDRLRETTGIDAGNWEARDWEIWWVTKSGWDWLESKGADVERAKRIMNAQRRAAHDPGAEAASSLQTEDTEALLEFLRNLHSKEGRDQLDNTSVFDKVVEIGKNTRDAGVALNVVWILREVKDAPRREKAKMALVEMLSKKENHITYENIIALLAEWKVKEAVEPLVYLVEDEKYGDAAVDALEKITGKMLGSKKRADWEKLLAGHSTGIKEDFIKRLKESEGKELLQVLSDLGSSRYKRLWTDPNVYETLVGISDRISTWEQVSAYVPVLTRNDKDPMTQKTLIKMAGSLENLQLKKFLLESLATCFPNGQTIDFLLDFLEKGERRLRMAVRSMLYQITGASSSERLRTKSNWLEYFSKHPAARWGRKK